MLMSAKLLIFKRYICLLIIYLLLIPMVVCHSLKPSGESLAE